jgi:hypothetical protein
MKLTFAGIRCQTQWGTYRNGKVALQLIATAENPDLHPGAGVATASINTEHHLEIDEVIIKDYDENTGMVVALVAAGIVEPVFSPVFIGHYGARCGRCRLTQAAREEAFGLKAKS